MPVEIPNLWSTDIKTEVLSPAVILRTQASLLGQMTRGILEAEVVTDQKNEPEDEDDMVDLGLFVVAPALDNYRHQLIRVIHQVQLVYPATVIAECFGSGKSAFLEKNVYGGISGRAIATSDTEFIDIVRMVLRSPEANSVIHSLIARSNDLKLKKEEHDS